MPDFVILMLDQALAATASVTLDVLSVANQAARSLGTRTVTWEVIGAERQVRLTNGLWLEAAPLETPLPPNAALVIPSIGLDSFALASAPDISLAERYANDSLAQRIAGTDIRYALPLIQAHHQAQGQLAASCSGVLALAAAGVLDGRQATTHWRIGQYLQQAFPQIRVDITRTVVEDGQILTGGAALAHLDLMLHLVRARMGQQVADLTMRYLLIDGRLSQSRYMVWSHLRASDEVVARFEAAVEAALPGAVTVRAIAQSLHLTEKTLSRRIRQATGSSPVQLVQAVRMRKAQFLLETTRLPLAKVAEAVGYRDATALRKLSLKHAGLAPGRLRPSVC